MEDKTDGVSDLLLDLLVNELALCVDHGLSLLSVGPVCVGVDLTAYNEDRAHMRNS